MSAFASASVVMPVFNGEHTIRDALTALVPQVRSLPSAELIVVDNGSRDGTRDLVRAAGVTMVVEKTRGPSAARNAGLRLAGGDVIVYLDADTLPARGWLRALLAPFADASVMLAAGRTLCYVAQTAAERYVAASGLYDTERAIGREVFPFAPSLNMAVRRDAALAIGGWCEALTTGEDVDFSHRLLRKYPSRIAYAERAVLFHRTRSEDAGLRRQAWTYGEGAAALYLRYPEALHWDFRKSLTLAGQLGMRSAMPALLRLGKAFGLASSDQVEFARYHRLWNWYFWRGFFNIYGRRERRAS